MVRKALVGLFFLPAFVPAPLTAIAQDWRAGMTPEVVAVLAEAWDRCGRGSADRETVVLLVGNDDGSLEARLVNAEVGHRQASFAWNLRTVAVFHTHPTASQFRPALADRMLADQYRVPVLTMTSRGLWEYDPESKHTRRVIRGLDWLKLEAWSAVSAAVDLSADSDGSP